MRLIAIDGRSGSGKTAYTARHFPRANVIRMDDLYPGWDGLIEGTVTLAERVLRPLREGERAAYRRFDWYTGAFADEVVVEPADLIVVEGVGSSAPPATGFFDERIWLSADNAVRRARALARDGDTFAPHWDRWAAQEDTLFPADPPPWTTRVVDTSPDPRIVADLSARLHEADPMGLSGAPRDEYDSEAAILADQLPGLDEAAAIASVRRCFDLMFWPGAVGNPQAVAIAADLGRLVDRQ